MSDNLKHECGVALLRLRRSLPYYAEKYGSAYYGLEKLSLLLEKQHNRGQDGAGIACIGLNAPPGRPFYQIQKSCVVPSLANVLESIGETIRESRGKRRQNDEPDDENAIARLESLSLPFLGEVYLGHLRYGTGGVRSLAACHPFSRHSAWPNNTILTAGNFCLTNTREIFLKLVENGHHPTDSGDSEVMLTQLAHSLDQMPRAKNGRQSRDIIALLKDSTSKWDGAFVITGTLGNGDAFAFRDAAGIHPAYYYHDDEVAVVASERVAIQTSFNLEADQVPELPPGHALIIPRDGEIRLERILPEREPRRCVFERIYFSRGNDADIHRERRAMGAALAPGIMESINGDIDNTVFSYVPNTAQVSWHGLIDRMAELHPGNRIRFAQIAIKDAKFRTFIADVNKLLFQHVYDITYGVIRPNIDNLVMIDDSIVRGNTVRNAILPILARLQPRKIVIATASPPIYYPDFYGIDMASFDQLVAFEAAVSLLKQQGKTQILTDCVRAAEKDLLLPDAQMSNRVKPIYDAFTQQEISDEITRLLKPSCVETDFGVVFQTRDALRACCPEHTGDWYFSGDYPTPGGTRIVNQALIDYANKNDGRIF